MDISSGLPPHKSAAEILAHPRFAEARRVHCDVHLELYRHTTYGHAHMALGRNTLFALVLCQYAGHDPADRATWPTIGRLHQFAADFGLVSPRMADDFVARLKYIGYLDELPAPEDRRIKLLRPTAAMLAHDQLYNRALFAPLMTLYPGPVYQLALDLDPAFNIAQRRVGLSLLGVARSVISRNPLLRPMFARDAAFGVIISLIQRAMQSGGELAEISNSEISRWLGVSRTHVRAILRDLELVDLIAPDRASRRQRIELRPQFYHAFDAFLADVLSAQDVLAELAMADLRSHGA